MPEMPKPNKMSKPRMSTPLQQSRDITREDAAACDRLERHIDAYYASSANCAAPHPSVEGKLYGVRKRALAALVHGTAAGTVPLREVMGGATLEPTCIINEKDNQHITKVSDET